MDAYLMCSADKGQFPDEFSVKGNTASGEMFSLFAPKEFVKPNASGEAGSARVRVSVLESDDQRALVRLPAQTLENGATVIVSKNQLDPEDA
ncbi:MAG: hypothetical protein ACOCZU_00645 [Planctomycetota bacterium]